VHVRHSIRKLGLLFVLPGALSCSELDSGSQTTNFRSRESQDLPGQRNSQTGSSSPLSESGKPTATPRPTPGSEVGGDNRKKEPILKSLDDGFQWLSRSHSPGKAYKISLSWFEMLNSGPPDLSLTPEVAKAVGGIREYKVSRWYRLPATEPCEYQFNYADPSKNSLQTVAVYSRGCPPMANSGYSEPTGFNRYGFRKCESETATFLGIKDVGKFNGAFGARIECNRGEYYSVHEIWYHPESNHPHRKVMEAGGYRMKGSSPFIREIARQTYENLADAIPENDYEKSPQSARVSYVVEGAVKSPGTVSGYAMCNIGNNGLFSSIHLTSLTIGFFSNRQWIHGSWEPSFTMGSGTFSFGAFINKNWQNGDIPGGTAALRFEKLGTSMYHRISIDGSIALRSKYFGVPAVHHVTAKSFTPFVCFANSDVNSSTGYRDVAIGDPADL
jgi:hypothetical protein